MEHIKIFGKLFKKLRQKTGMTLRKFCLTYGLDPANYSRVERGKAAPPKSRDKLETLANHFGLERETDEWYDFFDAAAACSGTIPQDIMDNSELANKLPLIFRTIRGQKIEPEKLKLLAEIIRRS